ncbi:MAG: NAD(P)-dependent oxidoreductase [Alicyclobacillus sp.]|nr:NAD(P)-dependent oxidoreductase [Alicyclobacillus sp.]
MTQPASPPGQADRLGTPVYRALTEAEVIQEANRCLYCYDAPCTQACPTHIDVPSFIQKIATGNVIGSARVIMEANPLGASCARVCPTEELCEGACVLNDSTAPIRIGDLQRYATDRARAQGVRLFEPGPETGRSVAVVGGGPAGLAAARELRRLGHAVTLYERKALLGGLNTYGIVPFRLPADVAVWEAEQVAELGVNVRTGVEVGRDVSAEELLVGYDSVVIAVGMGSVPRLGIPGEDLEGVWDALEFIEQAKHGQDVGPLGEAVAVIGAGNTAIDAATCSRRLGAPYVTIYYRRTEREMTAYPFEYAFARQEGVDFRWLCAPVRILGEGGKVCAVEFIRMRLEPDPNRPEAKPKPVPVPGSEFTVSASTVIRAIGQERLTPLLEAFGIEHADGVPRIDEEMRTSRRGVFAIGDCIFQRGGREAMVVEAAEQGKRAAAAVNRYLAESAASASGGEWRG